MSKKIKYWLFGYLIVWILSFTSFPAMQRQWEMEDALAGVERPHIGNVTVMAIIAASEVVRGWIDEHEKLIESRGNGI